MTDNYTIIDLDLTNAGFEKIEGPWQLLRLLDAVNAGGDIIATTKLSVRAGRDEEDLFPLRLGNAVRVIPATKMFFIEWDAQAGVTATIGLSADAAQVDWDADPPAQVTTISGVVDVDINSSVTLDVNATPVGTTTTEETKAATLTGSGDIARLNAGHDTIAADTDQREIIIQADAANTGALMIRDDGGNNLHELGPGGAVTLATSDALQLRNDSGATQNYRYGRVKD